MSPMSYQLLHPAMEHGIYDQMSVKQGLSARNLA
jgi:hypothetical protein